jgi:hypothetical protein
VIRRALILGLFWAAAVGASADQPPRQVLLRHEFAPGDTLQYRGRVEGKGTFTIMGQPQPVTFQGEFTLIQKVVQRDAQGAADIATTVKDGFLVLGTPTVSQRRPISLPTLTQTISPQGRLLKPQAWGSQGGPDSGAHVILRRVIERIHLLEFPDQPVAAGDSWLQAPQPPAPEPKPEAASEPADPAPPPAPTRTFSLLGFERLGKRDCAKIRATADSPLKETLPPDPLGNVSQVEGRDRLVATTHFALEAGRVVRQVTSAHTTLRSETRPASGGPPIAGETDLTATVTLELQ